MVREAGVITALRLLLALDVGLERVRVYRELQIDGFLRKRLTLNRRKSFFCRILQVFNTPQEVSWLPQDIRSVTFS